MTPPVLVINGEQFVELIPHQGGMIRYLDQVVQQEINLYLWRKWDSRRVSTAEMVAHSVQVWPREEENESEGSNE